MDSSKDALQSVSFDGKHSGYRDFRGKTLLAIAKAWRATEHLNIAELRTPTGFLTVIKAFDEHYTSFFLRQSCMKA